MRTHIVGLLAIGVGLIGAGLASDLLVRMPALRLGVVTVGVLLALLGLLANVLALWRDIR